jgi:hypothetical protein
LVTDTQLNVLLNDVGCHFGAMADSNPCCVSDAIDVKLRNPTAGVCLDKLGVFEFLVEFVALLLVGDLVDMKIG